MIYLACEFVTGDARFYTGHTMNIEGGSVRGAAKNLASKVGGTLTGAAGQFTIIGTEGLSWDINKYSIVKGN